PAHAGDGRVLRRAARDARAAPRRVQLGPDPSIFAGGRPRRKALRPGGQRARNLSGRPERHEPGEPGGDRVRAGLLRAPLRPRVADPAGPRGPLEFLMEGARWAFEMESSR